MEIYSVGVARIVHNKTGEEYEIETDELNWDAVDSSEEPMGQRTHFQATVEHADLGILSWSIWEYPVGAENTKQTNIGLHELVEDFDYGLNHTPEDDEDGPAAGLYFSDNDPDNGITGVQLHRLSKANQIPYLTWWFHSYYEDPAMETPYNGREGGYLYVHGGPYNARDEIEEEFGRYASQETIEGATEEVESDGILDWAPTHAHPDRADEGFEEEPEEEDGLDRVLRQLKTGAEPVYGSPEELAQRREILTDLDQFDLDLPQTEPEHGGFGHNNPPPDARFSEEELAELRDASTTIRAELGKEKPDASVVAQKTHWLKSVAGWFMRKIDVAVDAVVQGVVPIVGAALVLNLPAAYNWVVSFIGKLIEWLTMLMPF